MVLDATMTQSISVIVFCLHFYLSVQQHIVPQHLHDVQDATRTQELLERAMPALRQLVQNAQADLMAGIVALRQDNARLTEENTVLKEENAAHQQNADPFKQDIDFKLKGSAVVFTRWGRKDCPSNTTSVLYSGYAGGSRYIHTGAAAEYICMPPDPIWGPHKDLDNGRPISVGYVYGAEYERPQDMFGMTGTHVDIPCAVCLGTQHSVSVMIPGRTQCYPDWTEAYHGDLASGYHGHVAASQYICVDQDAQGLGGNLNQNGKLAYGVKSKCGPLPCPPYQEDKFLSCVVCLK